VALALCTGCFVVDDFYIDPTADDARSKAHASEAASSPSDGVVQEPQAPAVVLPAKPLPMPIPPAASSESNAPDAAASESTASDDAASVTGPTPGDAPTLTYADAGSVETGSSADAGASRRKHDAATETADVEKSEVAVPNPDTADAGAAPECEQGSSYDPSTALCTWDCNADEQRGPNGRCYWFGTQAVSFAMATSICSTRDTDWSLLSVRSEEEHLFIQEQLVADTWIGASDSQFPNTWRWLDDGTTFWSGTELGVPTGGAFTLWGNGEPSASSGENCGRYHGSSGSWRWSDGECDELYRPGCHGPAPMAPRAEPGAGPMGWPGPLLQPGARSTAARE
jgi:Lectin C-type domain